MDISYRIRKAALADAPLLAEIQASSWQWAFAHILPHDELTRMTDRSHLTAMYRSVLASKKFHGSILEIREAPHSMAFWGPAREETEAGSAELICIHSFPQQVGKGYGKKLMAHVLEEMRQAGYERVILWVFEKNIRARSFYDSIGFTLTPRQKTSFGDALEQMYQLRLT